MNFSEQLDKFVERGAIEHHKKVNPWIKDDEYYHKIETNQTIAAYVASGASIKPIVLKLYEGLKRYELAAFQIKGETFSVGSVAKEYIDLVERMIGEGK